MDTFISAANANKIDGDNTKIDPEDKIFKITAV